MHDLTRAVPPCEKKTSDREYIYAKQERSILGETKGGKQREIKMTI